MLILVLHLSASVELLSATSHTPNRRVWIAE
jgi:hypothetical protein